jgi:hypothetical protein
MSLVEQAKLELDRINFGTEDTEVMLDILNRFFDQWDSGGAVSCAGPILTRLIAGQPLAPLTGEDSEWMDPADSAPFLQNVRCSSVFKDKIDGRTYDIDMPGQPTITFPYDPVTKQVRPPVYEVKRK